MQGRHYVCMFLPGYPIPRINSGTRFLKIPKGCALIYETIAYFLPHQQYTVNQDKVVFKSDFPTENIWESNYPPVQYGFLMSVIS